MYKFLSLTLVLLFPLLFFAQDLPVLPLSATDSGMILHNDSLADYYYNLQEYKEASSYLDKNAMIYWKHNYFDEAIKYFKKSIKYNEKLQNYDGIAKINTNLALIYTDKGLYDSAYNYFEKTLAVRKAQNQKVGVVSALINESVVLNKLKRYDESIAKLQEALSIARELNDIKQMRSCYGMLAETYQKAGNVEKSLYYYNFFKTFNDYVTKNEIKKTKTELEKEAYLRKIAELEAENQKLLVTKQQQELTQQKRQLQKLTKEQQKLLDSLSKQEMVLKIFEQQSKIKELENINLRQEQRKKNLLISLSLVIILILLFSVLALVAMYKKQKRLNKEISDKNSIISQQKEELENIVVLLQEKNTQITDSINYASAIQKAIFSRNVPLSELTKDYFEIYLPKDIVSGDFFYTARYHDLSFIAVGDCTGHGVPGAFLTLIGYNLLDMIIKTDKIVEPDKIVKELSERFFQVLNQANTENLDSLEISLCVVDVKRNILEFSGEGNSLIVTEAKGVSRIYKANKHPFGFLDRIDKKNYTKQTIPLKTGQWFYLYTDGIIHQFNSEYKKFSMKRLVSFLEENHELTGEQKKYKFIKELNSWWYNTEQLDDISLIGFRIL